MQKHLKIILSGVIGIAVVAAIYFLFFSNLLQKSDAPPIGQKQTNSPEPENFVLPAQTNTEGVVSVAVAPKDLSPQSKIWAFEIVLDTHLFELDDDLTEAALLKDDQSNEYKPTVWEGDPPAGHHRKGVLKFNPIIPRPKFIELTLSQIGEVPERNFQWELP